MTLTDKDVLELNELCSALIDETLDEKQYQCLAEFLSTNEEARRFYVRATGLSASLFYYAGEMQTGAADRPAGHPGLRRFIRFAAPLALAASIALVFSFLRPRPHAAAAPTPELEFVARLTGSKDCLWTKNPLAAGARIQSGQALDLAAGFAEITFDSGAKVLLQGPATLMANSAWSATLNRGVVKATVPHEAIGFSIANPAVKVVDLGTEFVMSASAGAATDVLVLKGQIEATSHASSDQQPLLLNANESRRFALSGTSDVPRDALPLEKWNPSIPIDHFTPPITYAHWSFDEPAGVFFGTDILGSSPAASVSASAAEFPSVPATAVPSLHIPGRWKNAVQFNGHYYAKIPFPSISEDSPRTVAFWVKVPKDASLSNAYAMIAWNPNPQTLGFHPIQISWNRNPDEGIVGVLRTDYGRGYAVGATPLLDDRWHHVAVIFIPPDDPQNCMEVKQYVDGHLEGEGVFSPSGSDIFNSSSLQRPATAGALWLGCRLGLSTVRNERFRGAMDELFVADRPLEPQEITHLLTNNRF